MYLFLSTFVRVFQGHYGFIISMYGLVYLGLGTVTASGIVLFTIFNPRIQAARMGDCGAFFFVVSCRMRHTMKTNG